MVSMTKHPLTIPSRHHSSDGGRFRTKRSMGLWMISVIKMVKKPQAMEEVRQM